MDIEDLKKAVEAACQTSEEVSEILREASNVLGMKINKRKTKQEVLDETRESLAAGFQITSTSPVLPVRISNITFTTRIQMTELAKEHIKEDFSFLRSQAMYIPGEQISVAVYLIDNPSLEVLERLVENKYVLTVAAGIELDGDNRMLP